MDLGGAFTGFATAIATIFGLSRASRLRHAIEANMKLLSEMKSHEELAASRGKLAGLIDLQVERLREIGDGAIKKVRDPGGGFVGMCFTVLFALPIFWLAPRLNHWWGVLLFVVDVLLVLMLLGATISAYRSPPRKAKPDASA